MLSEREKLQAGIEANLEMIQQYVTTLAEAEEPHRRRVAAQSMREQLEELVMLCDKYLAGVTGSSSTH